MTENDNRKKIIEMRKNPVLSGAIGTIGLMRKADV